MKNLEKYKIPTLGKPLQYKGDLIYYEGSLLAHFTNVEDVNEHYFYKWCDVDEYCNRWVIIPVGIEQLVSFFKRGASLLELMQQPISAYLIDVDEGLNIVNTFICPINEIPYEYLPSHNSFFNEKQYEQYALTLKNSLSNE